MKEKELPGGRRMFTPDERLSKQQIMGFFSRMKAQRRIAASTSAAAGFEDDELDDVAEQVEHEEIARSVEIHHPIMTSDGKNLCTLSSEKELSRESLHDLRSMCVYFGIAEKQTRIRSKTCIQNLTSFVLSQCPECSQLQQQESLENIQR